MTAGEPTTAAVPAPACVERTTAGKPVTLVIPEASTAVEPVLCCRQVAKMRGTRRALDGVSLAVAPGEVYGLLGPNGAGKTTLISILCGVLDADSGTVAVDGQTMSRSADRLRARIGYVPQDIALYPDMSVRSNLRFFGRLYGLRGDHLDRRIADVLDVVGLADRADERIDRCSVGMRRRANIAGALLHEPRLLVLDEPTVGVDPQSRNAILERLRDLAGAGVAVLYASHYMAEVERLCDRVGILHEGRLIVEGTVAELVDSLASSGHVDVTVEGDAAALVTACTLLLPDAEVQPTESGLRVLAADPRRILPNVVEAAERSGTAVTSLEVGMPDLETVFLNLTGRSLRD